MRKFLICETSRRSKLFPSPSPSKKVLKCILLLDDLVFLSSEETRQQENHQKIPNKKYTYLPAAASVKVGQVEEQDQGV